MSDVAGPEFVCFELLGPFCVFVFSYLFGFLLNWLG